jgi:hypothetical protein
MFKNVASQKLIVFAFDSTTNLPKTGDAANITAYVSKDYGAVTVLGDTTATEMDSTNAKGYYLFDLTQAETSADTLLFSAKSATSNIVVVGAPATVFTYPPNFSSTSIDASGRVDVIKINGTSQTARDIGASVLLSAGTGTGQLDFTSGVVKANATQWLGGTIPAVNVTGVPLVDLKYTLGTISPATAGSVRADSVTGAVGSVTGAVGSVTARVTANTDQWAGGTIPAPNVTGVPLTDLKYTLGTISPATAGSVRADSVTGAVGSVTGAVGSVTGNVGGNVVGSVASVTARVTANTDQLAGVSASATNIARSTQAIVLGTVGSASSTTSIVTSSLDPAAAAADQFKGRIVTFDRSTTTANLRGQATNITANSSGGVLTVTALTTAPVSGDTFTIT